MARSPSATCAQSGAWRLPMTVVRLYPCCFSVKEKLWLSCSLASTWRSPKRLRKAPAPTKSTPSACNTSPKNKCPLPDSSGHFRTQMGCQCGLRRTLTHLLVRNPHQALTARENQQDVGLSHDYEGNSRCRGSAR